MLDIFVFSILSESPPFSRTAIVFWLLPIDGPFFFPDFGGLLSILVCGVRSCRFPCSLTFGGGFLRVLSCVCAVVTFVPFFTIPILVFADDPEKPSGFPVTEGRLFPTMAVP